MYTLQMEAASVVVFHTCSGFICICSEELVLVQCGARIGGHCGWPQCLGPAPVQCSTPHAGVYFCDDPIQSW